MSIFRRINTNMYHNNGIVETRILKTGKGILRGVNINKVSGIASTLTVYDNTSASGQILAIIDLNNANMLGSILFGNEGMNFTTGLTYITTGLLSVAFSVTFIWSDI